jgi:hypothetical protein
MTRKQKRRPADDADDPTDDVAASAAQRKLEYAADEALAARQQSREK